MGIVRNLAAGLLLLVTASTSAATKKEPFLLSFTNDIATTAGIGLLKDLKLPTGSTEIRVWIGFGIVIPEEMLRLQLDSQGRVTGEVLVHFPSDLTHLKKQDAERFRKKIMQGCTQLRKGQKNDVCIATFKAAPDWTALYKQLNHLGITTLPDESELPKPDSMVLDGISMVVEVRQGSDYRAYEYSNPYFRDGPEAKSASQIMKTIADVLRQGSGT